MAVFFVVTSSMNVKTMKLDTTVVIMATVLRALPVKATYVKTLILLIRDVHRITNAVVEVDTAVLRLDCVAVLIHVFKIELFSRTKGFLF